MAKPRVTVDTLQMEDAVVEQGTLMEHNSPPSMLVMVTGHADDDFFSGVCLEDGVYLEEGWQSSEFHLFRGSVRLTQGA
jgi:hypothetical protein